MGTSYRAEIPSLFATDAARYEPSLHEHPPYSVLDAAGGWWQHRCAYWQALGCRDAGRRPTVIRRGPTSASEQSGNVNAVAAGSQFSPVLTELLVSYYSEPGDRIVDPFCGGPVRGFVANAMQREYHGFDVRWEQIGANYEQYPDAELWAHGDARYYKYEGAEMVLTCPPYHDLERYSDQQNDLSAMRWDDFETAHLAAIANAAKQMATNGYIVWVVGDFRAPSGQLRSFPDLVARQMESIGLSIWNRHVVRHPLVTAPMRWRRQWDATRKGTTTHGEVIVGRFV